MINLHRTFATLIAVSAIAFPAMASTSQEDVQSCREAMDTQSSVDMSDYRLRFLSVKGNSRGRTLSIKAINQKGGESFVFTCTLDKSTVVALNDERIILFASR